MADYKVIIMLKDQFEKIKQDLAKSRATQVEIKYRLDPRLTVFENADLSFKKGFDAGFTQAEKKIQFLEAELEITKPLVTRAQFEEKIKFQNKQIEKLMSMAKFYADKNNWEQGESYAELSRIADSDLQYFIANRGNDIIGGKLAREVLELVGEDTTQSIPKSESLKSDN